MSELASPPSGVAARGRGSPDPEQKRPESEARGSADAPTVPATPSGTTAGAVLAERYRLRTRIGSDTAAGAEFWRAEDVVLQRDVAVTVLRRLAPVTGTLDTVGARSAPRGSSKARSADAPPGAEDPTGAARAGEMVVLALRSGSFEHGGCARLLDVLAPGASGIPDDVLGAAVSEWVPGRSLAETVADDLIKPLAAARALGPLAAAAEEAHRHGLVLGCDHPQRIRITPDGRAQLCFALPRPDVTPADDVRGLGAVLYALLTARWPLSGADAARAGLAAADRTPDGMPTPPSEQRPGVPVELDTLTRGTLGSDSAPGHVRTAAAVHRLLNEVVAEDDHIALFPPEHDGVPSAPGDVWQDSTRPTAPPDRRRRRNLGIGLAALALAVLVVLGFVIVGLSSMFSDGRGPAIVVGGAPVGPSDASPDEGSGGVGQSATVAGVEVYASSGDRDNADRVPRVIDGNGDSGWNTFTYKQQFPALKPGVGIMVSFASAVQLSALTIESPSAGTIVQVRSASSAEAALADTTPVAEVTLGDGGTPVSLAESQPVTHVLLWITKLGGGGEENKTEINELEFRRAGGGS